MKSVLLRSMMSLCLTVSALASAPTSTPEELRAAAQKLVNYVDVNYMEDSQKCESCPAQDCFSRKVEKSLGLESKLTNLLLCPDILLTSELKSDVLQKTGSINNDNSAVPVAKSDDEIALEFAAKQAAARQAAHYNTLVAFIFDPTELTRVQKAAVLRKLGWVSTAGVSAATQQVSVVGNDGGSFTQLPKLIWDMICPFLDNASLGSLALVEKSTMEAAEPMLYGRLVPIHNKVVWHYHPSSGPAPLLNHLSYLTFAMKAYGCSDAADDLDCVDAPLKLLDKQMEKYVDSTAISTPDLFLLAIHGVVGNFLTSDSESLQEVAQRMLGEVKNNPEVFLTPQVKLKKLFMQRVEDWHAATVAIKVETGFNEPGEDAEDSESDEEEACVIC